VLMMSDLDSTCCLTLRSSAIPFGDGAADAGLGFLRLRHAPLDLAPGGVARSAFESELRANRAENPR
jgi:hypothetical protein